MATVDPKDITIRQLQRYSRDEMRDSHVVTLEGRCALGMIEKWGMVAAIEGGEDSAGRQKLRLATPAELVERAFETARLAFKEVTERGLLVEVHAAQEEEG